MGFIAVIPLARPLSPSWLVTGCHVTTGAGRLSAGWRADTGCRIRRQLRGLSAKITRLGEGAYALLSKTDETTCLSDKDKDVVTETLMKISKEPITWRF